MLLYDDSFCSKWCRLYKPANVILTKYESNVFFVFVACVFYNLAYTNFNYIYFIECTWMNYICWLCIFIVMADEYRHLNKNDCAKSLRMVLLYGEFDNVPDFSRLYTFSML